MNNRKLITIFAVVFVDLLGFSLILPLVSNPDPPLPKRQGGPPMSYETA
jgi:hypothetical protein